MDSEDNDMADPEPADKSLAERWYDEQVAWQKTMREYADSLAKDENFLMHLGNAMRGSLLAGTPYPQQNAFGAEQPAPAQGEVLAEILFTLKRLDGRMRDLEAAIESLGAGRDGARSGAQDGAQDGAGA